MKDIQTCTFGLVILFLYVCYEISAQKIDFPKNNVNCINPQGEYVNCIPLTKCEVLFSIFKNRPIVKTQLGFLQQSTCGFEGEEPLVCCKIPQSSNYTLDKGIGDKKEKAKNQPKPDTLLKITTEKPSIIIQNPGQSSTESKYKPSPVSPLPTPLPARSPEKVEPTVPVDNSSLEITQRVVNHKNFKLLPPLRDCGFTFGTPRIIRTDGNAWLGTYPWLVLIGYTNLEGQKKFACAGSLISNRYVLTASNCIAQLPSGYKVSTIRIGEYNQSTDPDIDDWNKDLDAPKVLDVGVEEIIPHENYDEKGKKENDIGIIRLDKELKIGPFVRPICLPYGGEHFIRFNEVENSTRLILAGWGGLSFVNPGNLVLQDIRVPIVSMAACNAFYGIKGSFGDIDPGQFCAGGEAGRDSCKGDSGGPVMELMLVKVRKFKQVRAFQTGVVSVGPSLCGPGKQEPPALYSKVSYFVPWILDHMRQ